MGPHPCFIGIFLYMLGKDKDRRSGVGKIMVGFSVLMAGMNTMSTAMSPLADEPGSWTCF